MPLARQVAVASQHFEDTSFFNDQVGTSRSSQPCLLAIPEEL